MGASSSSHSPKKGSEWSYQLVFYSRTEKPCRDDPELPQTITRYWLLNGGGKKKLSKLEDSVGYVFNIAHDALQIAMGLLIDGSENIEKIWVFKSKLDPEQDTLVAMCHQFVVIETANWYWSIEKNDKEILIQRSKFCSYKYKDDKGLITAKYGVRDCCRRSQRLTPLRRMSSAFGRKTMRDLIKFIVENNELNKKYRWDFSNCKAFAKRVFDEFARMKYHEILLGCDLPHLAYDISLKVN